MSNRRKLRRPRRYDPQPVRIPLRESAPADAPSAVALAETTTGALIGAAEETRRGQLVQIISAGWGSSGYYSDAVLAEAARQRVFGKGLPMYLNHPSRSEEHDRPERSVLDLAAVLAEDARYDPDRKALTAPVRVFAAHRERLNDPDFASVVGLSIRAQGLAEQGTAEGRDGLIVTEITNARSVDYVTTAGRGGKVLALLESAPAQVLREARTLGGWLESRLHLTLTQYADEMYGDGRLTREERITLSTAIGEALTAWTTRVEAEAPQLFQRDLYAEPDVVNAVESGRLVEATADEQRRAIEQAVKAAHGGGDTYTWVRDWDPDRGLVWFDATGPDGTRTWQRGYTADGDPPTVTLTGEPVEVVPRMVYDSIPTEVADTTEVAETAAPPQPAPDETATQQDTPGRQPADTERTGAMPKDDTSTITSADIEAKLAEALRRADEAEQRAAADRTRLARFEATEAARPIADTLLNESGLPTAARTRVLAAVTRDVPLTESNTLNEQGFRTLVEAEIKAEGAYLASLREATGAGQVWGMGSTPLTESTPARDEATTTALVEAYKARGMSPEAARLAATGRAF